MNSRPIGDEEYLDQLVTEYIYYGFDRKTSDVSIIQNMIVDENVVLFRKTDVEDVFKKYFSPDIFDKCMTLLSHYSGEYSIAPQFIGEEVLYDTSAHLPYSKGFLPVEIRSELDQELLESE